MASPIRVRGRRNSRAENAGTVPIVTVLGHVEPDDDDDHRDDDESESDRRLRMLRADATEDEQLRLRVWRRARDNELLDPNALGLLADCAVSDDLCEQGFEGWCADQFGGGRYEGRVTGLNSKGHRTIRTNLSANVAGAPRAAPALAPTAANADAAADATGLHAVLMQMVRASDRRTEQAEQRAHEIQLEALKDKSNAGGIDTALATIVSVMELTKQLGGGDMSPEQLGMKAVGELAEGIKTAAQTGQLATMFGKGEQQQALPNQAQPTLTNTAPQAPGVVPDALHPQVHAELVTLAMRGTMGMDPVRAVKLALDALEGVDGAADVLVDIADGTPQGALDRLREVGPSLGIEVPDQMHAWWLAAFEALNFKLSEMTAPAQAEPASTEVGG